MTPDKPHFLPPEFLEQLRAAGWKTTTGGYDAVLLDEADRGAARARDAFDAGSTHMECGAAAATILCAAAACEYRLSEYLAHWEFASGDLPPELVKIRNEPNARAQWRDLLRYRLPGYDLGSSVEYLHLGCLFQTRDIIAHRNARIRLIGGIPEVLETFVRQRILPVRELASADWPESVLVHEVAVWACRVARDWLALADRLLPLVC